MDRLKYVVCKVKIIFIFTFIYSSILHANNVDLQYNINNYTPKHYNAGMQNWEGSLSKTGNLYIANNSGLLTFNGNNWNLYQLPNEQTIRAVYILNNKIFTAGDNNIGFWERDLTGRLKYNSLKGIAPEKLTNDNFWSIAYDGKFLYFQSFSQILQYDGKKLTSISKDCHMLLLQDGNDIYVHRLYSDLFKLENGKFESIVNQKHLINEELKFGFKTNDSYIFGTTKGKVFIKDKTGKISPFAKISEQIAPYLVDCATVVNNKLFIGTLGGGIFVFSLKGDYEAHITNKEHLQGNTVHNMVAHKNKIWAILDNGISEIEINPTLKLWKSNSDIGSLYKALKVKDDIYIATNQGLYLTKLDLSQQHSKVKNLKGEVFSIDYIKGELICGTSEGCFRFTNNSWEQISQQKGIYDFKYVSKKGEEYLISPSYLDIIYFKYTNGKWKEFSSLTGFQNSLTNITAESPYILWSIHPQKGIYRMRVDNDLKNIKEVINFKKQKGLTNYKKISIQKIDGKIFFFSPEGVFQYVPEEGNFSLNKKLTEDLKEVKGLNLVIQDSENLYWIIKNHELFLYRITDQKAEEIGKESLYNYDLEPLHEKIHISRLNEKLSVLSTVDGAVIVNKEEIIKRKKNLQKSKLKLHSVSYYDKEIKYVDIKGKRIIKIPHKAVNIEIRLSNSLFSESSIIRYHLKNEAQEWGTWNKEGIIKFTKLPRGKHELEIESYDGGKLIVCIQVTLPWYFRYEAISLYIILVLILFYVILKMRANKKRKKLINEHQLEQQRKDEEITRLTNEKLKNTIENQKTELKDKLRVVSQKQELLLKLSNEIDLQKKELGDRYPKKMYEKLKGIISKGMSEEKDFMLFQNYYQEINRDFILKLKELHPNLSSQELKFCSLIRSNLSTKNIASILNITARSVELKRYRLKKKLDIEENVIDYILGL